MKKTVAMVRATLKTSALFFACLFVLLWVKSDGETAKIGGLFQDYIGILPAPDMTSIQAPFIIRSRLVAVDFAQLAPSDPSPGGATISRSLALNLFPDFFVTAVINKVQRNSSGSYSWVGSIDGMPLSSVVLVVDGNRVVGNISTMRGSFQIRYATEGGVHAIHQVDPSKFPPDKEPLVPPKSFSDKQGSSAPATAQGDDGSIIDVLVVYTESARTTAGSVTAMNALIDLAEIETNTSLSNSGIGFLIRVVRKEEVVYSETGFRFSQALSDVTTGLIPKVLPLRDTYGADVVVFLVKGDNSQCGLSWLMDPVSSAFESKAFAVVQQNCATGVYSFGHEIGHILSARHDRASDNTNSPFTYNHGYVDSVHSFRTIMSASTSCTTCLRIQYWSNPDISYLTFPIGVAEGNVAAADNRKTLTATARTVANFRSSRTSRCVTNLPIPSSSMFSSRAQRIISPYWQADSMSYSFIAVSHPSLNNSPTQVGVVVSAFLADGTGLYGTAEFAIMPGETKKVFIVNTNHPSINAANLPSATVITGVAASCFGQLAITPKTTDTTQNLTSLSLWGAIVSSSGGGFALEFIGDLADSRNAAPDTSSTAVNNAGVN